MTIKATFYVEWKRKKICIIAFCWTVITDRVKHSFKFIIRIGYDNVEFKKKTNNKIKSYRSTHATVQLHHASIGVNLRLQSKDLSIVK